MSHPGLGSLEPPHTHTLLKMLSGPEKFSSAFEEMAFVLMHSTIVIVLPGS